MIKDWVEWGPVLVNDPVGGGVREIGSGLVPGPGTHFQDMPTLGNANERVDSKARARVLRSRLMGGGRARTAGGIAYDITNLDKKVGGAKLAAGYGVEGIKAPNSITELFSSPIQNSSQVDAADKLLRGWRGRSTSAWQMPDQESTPRKFTEEFLETAHKGGWSIFDIRTKMGPFPSGYKTNPDLVTPIIGGSLGEALFKSYKYLDRDGDGLILEKEITNLSQQYLPVASSWVGSGMQPHWRNIGATKMRTAKPGIRFGRNWTRKLIQDNYTPWLDSVDDTDIDGDFARLGGKPLFPVADMIGKGMKWPHRSGGGKVLPIGYSQGFVPNFGYIGKGPDVYGGGFSRMPKQPQGFLPGGGAYGQPPATGNPMTAMNWSNLNLRDYVEAGTFGGLIGPMRTKGMNQAKLNIQTLPGGMFTDNAAQARKRLNTIFDRQAGLKVSDATPRGNQTQMARWKTYLDGMVTRWAGSPLEVLDYVVSGHKGLAFFDNADFPARGGLTMPPDFSQRWPKPNPFALKATNEDITDETTLTGLGFAPVGGDNRLAEMALIGQGAPGSQFWPAVPWDQALANNRAAHGTAPAGDNPYIGQHVNWNSPGPVQWRKMKGGWTGGGANPFENLFIGDVRETYEKFVWGEYTDPITGVKTGKSNIRDKFQRQRWNSLRSQLMTTTIAQFAAQIAADPSLGPTVNNVGGIITNRGGNSNISATLLEAQKTSPAARLGPRFTDTFLSANFKDFVLNGAKVPLGGAFPAALTEKLRNPHFASAPITTPGVPATVNPDDSLRMEAIGDPTWGANFSNYPQIDPRKARGFVPNFGPYGGNITFASGMSEKERMDAIAALYKKGEGPGYMGNLGHLIPKGHTVGPQGQIQPPAAGNPLAGNPRGPLNLHPLGDPNALAYTTKDFGKAPKWARAGGTYPQRPDGAAGMSFLSDWGASPFTGLENYMTHNLGHGFGQNQEQARKGEAWASTVGLAYKTNLDWYRNWTAEVGKNRAEFYLKNDAAKKAAQLRFFDNELRAIASVRFDDSPKLTSLKGGKLKNAAREAEGIQFAGGPPANVFAEATKALENVYTQGVLDEPVEFYWEAAFLRQQIMNAEESRGVMINDKNASWGDTIRKLTFTADPLEQAVIGANNLWDSAPVNRRRISNGAYLNPQRKPWKSWQQMTDIGLISEPYASKQHPHRIEASLRKLRNKNRTLANEYINLFADPRWVAARKGLATHVGGEEIKEAKKVGELMDGVPAFDLPELTVEHRPGVFSLNTPTGNLWVRQQQDQYPLDAIANAGAHFARGAKPPNVALSAGPAGISGGGLWPNFQNNVGYDTASSFFKIGADINRAGNIMPRQGAPSEAGGGGVMDALGGGIRVGGFRVPTNALNIINALRAKWGQNQAFRTRALNVKAGGFIPNFALPSKTQELVEDALQTTINLPELQTLESRGELGPDSRGAMILAAIRAGGKPDPKLMERIKKMGSDMFREKDRVRQFVGGVGRHWMMSQHPESFSYSQGTAMADRAFNQQRIMQLQAMGGGALAMAQQEGYWDADPEAIKKGKFGREWWKQDMLNTFRGRSLGDLRYAGGFVPNFGSAIVNTAETYVSRGGVTGILNPRQMSQVNTSRAKQNGFSFRKVAASGFVPRFAAQAETSAARGAGYKAGRVIKTDKLSLDRPEQKFNPKVFNYAYGYTPDFGKMSKFAPVSRMEQPSVVTPGSGGGETAASIENLSQMVNMISSTFEGLKTELGQLRQQLTTMTATGIPLGNATVTHSPLDINLNNNVNVSGEGVNVNMNTEQLQDELQYAIVEENSKIGTLLNQNLSAEERARRV
jgi:hypothetical protein